MSGSSSILQVWLLLGVCSGSALAVETKSTARPADAGSGVVMPLGSCSLDGYDGYWSGIVNVPIPDNVITGTSIGFVQTAADGQVWDGVIVDVNIEHTYAGDLILGLYYDIDNDNIGDVGPVALICTPGLAGCDFEGCCGCEGDLAGSYRFSDDGAGLLGEVSCDAVLASGCFSPDPAYGPLATFAGLPTGGRFQLYAWDYEAGDIGSVVDFTVWAKAGCNHPLREVPGEYATIPLALEAACDGDIVRIAPGSYPAVVFDLNGKGVTLQGANPAVRPAIDSVHLDNAGRETSMSEIEVTGEVYIEGYSGYVVSGCTISGGCQLFGFGGDISVVQSEVAGELYVSCGDASVQGSTVGSIHLFVQDDAHVENCVTTRVLADCRGNGGAMLRGNTVVGEVGADQPGIWVTDYQTVVTIERNIVVGRPDAAQVGVRLQPDPGAPAPIVNCNDVWRCQVRYSGLTDPTGTDGNFSLDPRFCDPLPRNFNLDAASPCLAGNHPAGANCGLIGARPAGCTLPVSIEDDFGGVAPLITARPNPARGAVLFSITPGDAAAKLQVFDASGRSIWDADLPASSSARQATWDRTDRSGDPVASGVYFYRVDVGGKRATNQLILLR